jgi:hypothetical protein
MNIHTGTPKTIIEAINVGLTDGKLKEHVKDFLAQKFGVAMLLATPDEADRLRTLFQEIMK